MNDVGFYYCSDHELDPSRKWCDRQRYYARELGFYRKERPRLGGESRCCCFDLEQEVDMLRRKPVDSTDTVFGQ